MAVLSVRADEANVAANMQPMAIILFNNFIF